MRFIRSHPWLCLALAGTAIGLSVLGYAYPWLAWRVAVGVGGLAAYVSFLWWGASNGYVVTYGNPDEPRIDGIPTRYLF